jgi:hypothetical protein
MVQDLELLLVQKILIYSQNIYAIQWLEEIMTV